MTDEQIKELKRLAATDNNSGVTTDFEWALRRALPRLLAERERLLTALRGCFDLARSAEFGGDLKEAMAACFEIERRTATALAFAEESA